MSGTTKVKGAARTVPNASSRREPAEGNTHIPDTLRKEREDVKWAFVRVEPG